MMSITWEDRQETNKKCQQTQISKHKQNTIKTTRKVSIPQLSASAKSIDVVNGKKYFHPFITVMK